MTRQEELKAGMVMFVKKEALHSGWKPETLVEVLLRYMSSQGVALVYDIQTPFFGKQWARFESLILA